MQFKFTAYVSILSLRKIQVWNSLSTSEEMKVSKKNKGTKRDQGSLLKNLNLPPKNWF